MEFKDYYKILGVARGAGDDDIKKSFRKLARLYHPDVAKDKKVAEEKFKEINEAYEVLGDPAKRKQYDELGADWKQGQQFRPPPGWDQAFRAARGGQGRRPNGGVEFEFGGTGFSDFFESLFGGRRGGFGRGDFGRGFVHEQEAVAERGEDIQADLMVTLHEAATGGVRAITLRHPNGRSETHKVRIPAGVQEGQRMRVVGRGHTGLGGGAAGDLYLRVRFARHPDFTVRGSDLEYELDLAPWEAVLGAEVSVPLLDGRVSIKIPAGAQNGQRLRVRGRGLPKHAGGMGDLYVVLCVQSPANVSPEERELWEKLARESAFRPRD